MGILLHTSAVSTDSTFVETSALNTTGATSIYLFQSGGFAGGHTPTDTFSNTWTLLQDSNVATANIGVAVFKCDSPTVGAGHKFAYNDTGKYPSLCAIILDGTPTPSIDQSGKSASPSTSTATTIQSTTITPTVNNEIILCGLYANNQTVTPTINQGFTVLEFQPHGTAYSCAIASLTQTTAALVNPTWTKSADIAATVIVSIKTGVTATADVRLTQEFVEVLTSGTAADVRLTLEYAEVLIASPVTIFEKSTPFIIMPV